MSQGDAVLHFKFLDNLFKPDKASYSHGIILRK